MVFVQVPKTSGVHAEVRSTVPKFWCSKGWCYVEHIELSLNGRGCPVIIGGNSGDHHDAFRHWGDGAGWLGQSFFTRHSRPRDAHLLAWGRDGVCVAAVGCVYRHLLLDVDVWHDGEIEVWISVEYCDVVFYDVNIEFFIGYDEPHAPLAIIGPIPLSPAIFSFNHIDQAGARFDFEFTIDFTAVLIETFCCVQGDVLKGVFACIHVEGSSWRTSDEDVDLSVIVASICIFSNKFIRVNRERKGLVANGGHCWNCPVHRDAFFAVGRYSGNVFTNACPVRCGHFNFGCR